MGIPMLCAVMAMLCLPPQDTLAPGSSSLENTGVSEARYERFSRGINLPGWLWLNRGPVEEFEKRFPDEDLELIKSLGLTCVRVPVDMANIHDPGAPGSLKPREMGILERGLERILASGLAVIFDLHSISQAEGGSDYSGPLGRDDAFTAVFIGFWEALAVRLARFDPERLIIEPMNEPVLLNRADTWPPLQERIVKAIRAKAPGHTILATGALWSNLHTLIKLRPLEDPNILYNFHFYEPHIFTHQGATWSMEVVKPLREVPYPSTPEAVAPALARQSDEQVRRALRAYGEERWDTARIEREIGKAAAWAADHGVRLLCNEWGCYRNFTPPASRAAWTRDVRTALESHGIGWCMWEFDQSFGLVIRTNGRAVVDRNMALALGLRID